MATQRVLTIRRSVVWGLAAIAATTAGCQSWQVGPVSQASDPPTTRPAEAGVQETPPSAATRPGATEETASSPQIAALQRDIEAFVNRFPDTDLARKIPNPAEPAAATVRRNAALHSPSDAAKSALAPVEATNAGKAVRNATSDSPARADDPAVPEVVVIAPPANAAAEHSPKPPPSPAVEPSGVRANAPASFAGAARAASLPNPAVPRIEGIEIAPVSAPAPAGSASARAEPNRPVSTAAGSAGRTIEGVMTELTQAVAERPNDVAAHFRLRMLQLAEGLDERATAPVEGLDPDAGGLFADLMRTLVAVRDALRDPLNRSTAAIDQTRRLGQRLRRQAPVSVEKLAIVSRVNSYGDYEELTPADFAAGQPVRVILYAEVANFRSEKGEGDLYRTLLGEKVEVFDAAGRSVYKQAHDRIPDICRRVRTDFFLALELALPETLAPGTYTVKATIEDKLSATFDQAQTTFRIVAPGDKPQTASARP